LVYVISVLYLYDGRAVALWYVCSTSKTTERSASGRRDCISCDCWGNLDLESRNTLFRPDGTRQLLVGNGEIRSTLSIQWHGWVHIQCQRPPTGTGIDYLFCCSTLYSRLYRELFSALGWSQTHRKASGQVSKWKHFWSTRREVKVWYWPLGLSNYLKKIPAVNWAEKPKR